MNKKQLGLCLALSAVFGFCVIMLQYKLTQVSLQIPSYEETYSQLKESKEKLELEIRLMKNPQRLFEQKTSLHLAHLNFPSAHNKIAVSMSQTKPQTILDETKNSALNLPLAKVFP